MEAIKSGAQSHQGLSPVAALTRYEPPPGFVPLVTETTTRHLRYGFRAAGLGLLVGSGVNSEVVPMMPMAFIPNAPAWLLGIINLRGNLVPVCELEKLPGFSGNDAASLKPMILVLGKGDRAVGFVIEGLPVALSGLKPLNQTPALPEILSGHVQMALATENDIWLELDHEGFLLATS